LVLAVRRANGNYIGAPNGNTAILPDDVLTRYGPETLLRKLPDRLMGVSGDAEHTTAVKDQEKTQEKELNL